MPERPIIMFPSPERADRDKLPSGFPRTQKPDFTRQFERLQPAFTVLQSAFEQKNLRIQQSLTGVNPDFALVFETIGTAKDFYTAVKNVEGLEWLFDQDYDNYEPDDDFYNIDKKTKVKTSEKLSGKLFCVMSNQQALNQMLSLWTRHREGETNVFPRGLAGLRNVFTNIKAIRKWDALDRIAETQVLDYWRDCLEYDGDIQVPFEVELFYRNEEDKQKNAVGTILYEIAELGGRFLQECVIKEITYHALLVELPKKSIEKLVVDYETIGLVHVEDIMFFRPTCQSAFPSDLETESLDDSKEYELPTESPLIGLLDGMPLQNHPMLKNRVIIDDPDDFSIDYESKNRLHGTAMASLILYGDLNKNNVPIKSPIYFRPILRPKETKPGSFAEYVPNDKLLVDLLHRAIIRIVQGEGGEPPSAPSVRVINLSIGDPARQLATAMSPVARLLDYLSFRYKLLFVISAGNHLESITLVEASFADLKKASYETRNKYFFEAIVNNQRNMKVFSPAESLNSLTVGAVYNDLCNNIENDRLIFAVEQGMPSPISSFGKGYRSIITPDIYYSGGRKFIKDSIKNELSWAITNREPGCKVAAPFGLSSSLGQAFVFGTSVAAAQLTHEAAVCYDTLSQIFTAETGSEVPDDAKALLLKAMLVHGATWENISTKVSRATGDSDKQLSKWLGNGIPDISRVQQCTKERITLIGMGALKKDEGDLFTLPIPIDFSTKLVKRRLTVTLAYFSPIAPDKQLYRTAQLWFDVLGQELLVPKRQNTDWRNVRKGTLQHEIFTGESAILWNDAALKIKVNCKEEAGKIIASIPYCIFVSFEIAEGLDIDLYSVVETNIRQRVIVQNM